jgi:hypothetical protein
LKLPPEQDPNNHKCSNKTLPVLPASALADARRIRNQVIFNQRFVAPVHCLQNSGFACDASGGGSLNTTIQARAASKWLA